MKIRILKEGSKEGRLGKHVWPSADTRYKDPEMRPDEVDTDIEEKLYKELHAHFGAILNGTPLSKESVEAIKQILENEEYPNIFKRCTGKGFVVRGMRVSVEWLKKNAPEALESWTMEKNYDWNEPVKVNFEYKSQGDYGNVSSWAGIRFWNKAREFAVTRKSKESEELVSCILYANCDDGLFLNTQAFAKFIDGRYKKEFNIKKLNPQGGKEGELILLGDCKVNAIQLYGEKPRMVEGDTSDGVSMKIKILKEAAEKTIELEPSKQKVDDTWRDDELEPIGYSVDDDSWDDYDDSEDWESVSRTIPKKTTATAEGPEAILAAKGFENIKRLGSGLVGNVYSADWHSGLEVAVKVVPKGAIRVELPNNKEFNWSGEKEIRAYEGIKKARGQSKNIEKHFPEVYAIMPGGDNYFIFMERLTDEGPYTSVIDELFAGIESLVDPGKDLIDHGAWKDPSRRLFMYIKGDKSRNILLDRILYNIQSDEAIEQAKKWANKWYQYTGIPSYTLPRSYELIDELFAGNENGQNVFLDSFGNLQKEFEDHPWNSFVILGILEIIKKHDLQGFHMNSADIARQWVDLGRKGAPIGWYHRPPTRKAAMGGIEDDIASVYKEAESIKLALDDLESIMGLVGTDMHDKNVMMRPMTGDIVIVDVGLFKPRSEIKEGGLPPKVHAKATKIEKEGKPRDQAYAIAASMYKRGDLEEALYEIQFDRSKLAIQSRLNPNLWLKRQLISEIKEKLLQIAEDFADNTEINNKIEDITLTGGNASYNWHKTSDIDLHLVVDFKKFKEMKELVKEVMKLTRLKWNEDHNIMINGHEVEVYVQDKQEDHYSGGIYSLKNDQWVTEPLHSEVNYDYNTISKKAEGLADEIDAIERHYNEKDYEKAHKLAGKMKEKIRKLRTSGLEKEGLWSVENLAFKLLRNAGFLDQLADLYHNSYDKLMSMGGNGSIKIKISSNMDEKKKTGNDKYHWNVSSWHYDGGYGDKGPDAKWTTVKSDHDHGK